MFYNMIKPGEDEESDEEIEQGKGFKIIEEAKKEQFKQTKLSEKG